MRKIVILMFLTSCAGREVNAPPADKSIAITTPYGMGHGCYVEGLLYTARHVVEPRQGLQSNVSWSDGYNQEGLAVLRAVSSFTDLAMLQVVTGEPYLNHVKFRDTVAMGTAVEWFEYSYRSLPNAFRAQHRTAKVLRVIGGMIVIDKRPAQGASGSCVFGENGEVIGLIVWQHEVGAGLVARIHD